MKFKLPLVVRCIKENISAVYPTVNFGELGKEYDVFSIIPNGCYYTLRERHQGPMLGNPGAPNYIVNMDRFEPIEWMTDKGIVKKGKSK